MSLQLDLTGFDTEAYFRRIDYSGARTPTLDTLRAIVGHHTRAIPFENLNPLMRWPVRLDVGSLQEKIVRGGRGGYCYEQNLLLAYALGAIGFTPIGLAARVRYGVPEHVTTPKGHMLLRIDVGDETVLVDAGFGGLTLTGIARLAVDVEQATPHEPFRLVKAQANANADDYVMQAQVRGTWMSLYRFTLQEQWRVDYEVANWYMSTSPASHFLSTLVVARAETDRRYALRNTDFATHHIGGPTERRVLGSVDELRDALTDIFHVTLPDAPELDIALARIAATEVAV